MIRGTLEHNRNTQNELLFSIEKCIEQNRAMMQAICENGG